MITCVRHLAALALGLALCASAQAQNLPGSNDANNSPIHRANPNSRQGTESSIPPVRGPRTAPNPRPPTLENGGIRNGYDTRQQPARPSGSDTSRDRKTTD